MNTNTNVKCEPKFLSRSLAWHPTSGLTLSTDNKPKNENRRKSLFRRLSSRLRVALQAVAHGRFATLLQTYPVSNRTFFGVGLIIASFWIKNIFLLFDPSVGFPLSESVVAQLKAGIWPEGHWYYINWYWFISQIDDPLTDVVQWIGAFFIVLPPKKFPPAYFFGIPVGGHIGTIIWLCYCKSPLEVNSNPPWTFAVMGVMLTIGLVLSYEYLVHRYYHDFLRSVSALKSLIVHLPASMDVRLKEQAFDAEMKNFQSKF